MKNLQIRAGEGVEKREPSYTVVGMQIGVATSENSMEVSLKTKNRATIWFYNPTLGHIFIKDKNSNEKDTYMPQKHCLQ